MKNLIALVSILLVSITTLNAQKINWVTIEEAQELMKKEPRKIIMDVYTTWCGPCKMLDKNTFGNPDVAKYINENYYAIKFNAEGDSSITFKDNTFTNPNYDPAKKNKRNAQHQFARYLSVRAYPTMVFFDNDFNLIAPISGYLVPKQLEIYLKLFKTDKYKVVKSKEDWEKYQKEFVYEFKS
ncbi:thioredoxin fold domain-containing protein [Kordia sp. YSTF-M3]|uniref:Thioredoxin fold domain-containing protein n=1 Tax=Kordia aestuariivivens TaxID=2759037 RepID=A0ABR7QA18_9FLAO|nr:thioredoxin fold domain-containing protein [Kordia aestuariivivens]MBC8755416.1 thioredoxin fold domain-containing protein [Kordia aestuariivivens]